MKNNRKASIIWKLILLAACTWGLLDGAGITKGAYTPNFPHMYTNVSNLFAWLYFACAVVRLLWGSRREGKTQPGRPFAPVFKYTATVSLLATMLIGHFMVFNAMVQDGHIVWHLVVLHYVVPMMTLLDWILFDEKGKMPLWGPFAWISLGAGSLLFTLIAVGAFGVYMGGGTTADITPYPYTFLDPSIVGVKGVAIFSSAMVAGFIVLGYVMLAVDRLLARFASGRA